ncbi:uncharacterized protein EKO05_0010905 [Ascochyta rabiei]|uniref:Uncharacterized protein n=1 Tax=Didymella rabiei TaxID=5454 RepID=A0A162ZHH2_DIDRA|nr:uncharacterized protein EKO05_0010905 [Ascochyta rabiei]KZM20603.1 hypothetical protein ST47_g8230 [Ascochyta rabiei]UPX20680.1 hypothetical protein EKO05_0010905 [Ascochyta rabiei]
MHFLDTYRPWSSCGVKTGPRSAPRSTVYSSCRDVPDGDIDSTLTHWVCFCGWCWRTHTDICQERRMRRMILRLASLQYRLAAAFATVTFFGSIESYQDVSAGKMIFSSLIDDLPGSILHLYDFAVPAAEQTPNSVDLPEQVQLQACCVENCVDSIAFTCQALAYGTQGLSLRLQLVALGNRQFTGLSLRFREMRLEPRSVQHILFRRENDLGPFAAPTKHHTVLVISSGSSQGEPLAAGDERSEDFWSVPGSFVLGPTYWQYNFDTTVREATDYLWTRVKKTDGDHVLHFDTSLRRHEEERDQGQPPTEQHRALYRDVCLQAMDDAVYSEIQRQGGNQAFLGGRHQDFVCVQEELLLVVGIALADARETADNVYFNPIHEDGHDTTRVMWALVRRTRTIGHIILSAALREIGGT